MKKAPLSIFLIMFTAPLLMQCASQDDLTLIHSQLRKMDKKITELETTTVDEMRKRQASNAAQIDQLNQDLLALQGGLEETGHLNRTLKEQSKELELTFKQYAAQEEEKRLAEVRRLEEEISNKDKQLDDFSSQLKVQQENLNAIQQARVDEAKRKATAAARAAEQARAKANAASTAATSGSSVTRIRADKRKKLISAGSSPSPAAQASKPATGTVASKPSAQPATPKVSTATGGNLGKAQSLYNQGQFREAYQQFENISAAGGTGSDTVTAKYMMGECLFALKEYDQAILDYQNIITNHPSTVQAPAAMLKQAMAFEKLNDNDTAKILYKKLIATYKDSPEAQQAQQKIGSN